MAGSINTRDWGGRRRGVALAAAAISVCGVLVLISQTQVGHTPVLHRSFEEAVHAGWTVEAASVEPTGHGALVAHAGPDGAIIIRSPTLNLSADLCPTPRLLLTSRAPSQV